MNQDDPVMQELWGVKKAEVERFKTLENLFAHLQKASDGHAISSQSALAPNAAIRTIESGSLGDSVKRPR
jgi:hypothetical protein